MLVTLHTTPMKKDRLMIDPDMSDQQIRLHGGEMTAQEVRTARAFMRLANSKMGIDVRIDTMKLSGNRKEHFVRIQCGDRHLHTRKYTQGFYNRALYERDELRHVLLGEPKPDLLDSKYADLSK